MFYSSFVCVCVCVWFQCVYSLASMFGTVYSKYVCEHVVSCELLRVFVLKRTWFAVDYLVHKRVSDCAFSCKCICTCALAAFSCKCICNCALAAYMYVLCVSERVFSLVSVGQ